MLKIFSFLSFLLTVTVTTAQTGECVGYLDSASNNIAKGSLTVPKFFSKKCGSFYSYKGIPNFYSKQGNITGTVRQYFLEDTTLKASELLYVNGNLKSFTHYSIDGRIMFDGKMNNGKLNGPVYLYDSLLTKKWSLNFSNGISTIDTFYYSNGKIKYVCDKTNPVFDKTNKCQSFKSAIYDLEGNLIASGNSCGGLKIGKWAYFDKGKKGKSRVFQLNDRVLSYEPD